MTRTKKTVADKIVANLQRRKQPVTVSVLANAIDANPSTVRENLANLEFYGTVNVAGIKRGSVGRPAKTYTLAQ